jgi:hypothetical protein
MNGWFWSLVILSAISLGLSWGLHGKPRDYNGWTTFFAGLIEIFLIVMAVRHGGF